MTRAYEQFSRRLQSQLDASGIEPNFVNDLKDIASAREDVYLDFQVLFDRWTKATGYRGPQPVLDDLYEAYDDLFKPRSRPAAHATDLSTALANFDTQYGQLRSSIARTSACWEKSGDALLNAMRVYLRTPRGFDWVLQVECIIFPWLADSHCAALCTDLPTLMHHAQGHLNALSKAYASLLGTVKQVEFVRVGEHPGAISYNTACDIVHSAPLISHLLTMFDNHLFVIHTTAGRAPEAMKEWDIY
ncbi:hypothetical protein B0H19DRAFT_1376161 [Mycena capillaripes]|nr:hypothetical protein B0H19DRAFT_1376161 [Mycena capillaripes]